jgi:hypothetical protein
LIEEAFPGDTVAFANHFNDYRHAVYLLSTLAVRHLLSAVEAGAGLTRAPASLMSRPATSGLGALSLLMAVRLERTGQTAGFSTRLTRGTAQSLLAMPGAEA